MEYVPGGDLMDYVRDAGAFAEGEARAIAEQILQAVFVLHEHSLTHRDIKPQVTMASSRFWSLSNSYAEYPRCRNIPCPH